MGNSLHTALNVPANRTVAVEGIGISLLPILLLIIVNLLLLGLIN
jgi:hypothetical protein